MALKKKTHVGGNLLHKIAAALGMRLEIRFAKQS